MSSSNVMSNEASQNSSAGTEEARGGGDAGLGGVAGPSGVRIPVVTCDTAVLDFDWIQSKFKEIKELARQNDKKSELVKHRAPQIKRSLNFLYDVKFHTQDLKENLDQIMKSFQGSNSYINVNALHDMSSNLESLNSIVEAEMQANKIASNSRFGWKTVKFFEDEEFFKGENAADQTKKLRDAEFKASKELQVAKRRKLSRWDQGGGASSSSGAGGVGSAAAGAGPSFRSAWKRPENSAAIFTCFKCLKPGHKKINCPDLNK